MSNLFIHPIPTGSGGGGGGPTPGEDGSSIINIPQPGNGFSILTPVYQDTGTGNYLLAQADNETTSDVSGLVMVSGDTFTLVTSGYYTDSTAEALGNYYLDATTAGGRTQVQPTGEGVFVRPLYRRVSATKIYIYENYYHQGAP